MMSPDPMDSIPMLAHAMGLGRPVDGEPDQWATTFDPLNSNDDAATLRAWIVGQGWAFHLRNLPATEGWVSYVEGYCHRVPHLGGKVRTVVTVTDYDEPDPARRERLATVLAAVAAVRAMREVGA